MFFSKRYAVPRRRQNIISFKFQNNYICTMISIATVELFLNYFLQVYYSQLGKEQVFDIWWFRSLSQLVSK